MATEKTVKFDETLTNNMKVAYTAAKTEAERDAVVQSFAASTGYGVRSIRGKMSRDGYYISKPKKNKAGENAERKETVVEEIAGFMGVNIDRVKSLENATKLALQTVRDFMKESAEDQEATD